MAKVYIVNFAGHDYRSAEKWGELKILTTGYVTNRFDRLTWQLVDGLKESTEEDWLIPSGMLSANMIAAAIWLRKHGELKMLVWDAKKGYIECRLGPEHLDYLIEGIEVANDGDGAEGRQDREG